MCIADGIQDPLVAEESNRFHIHEFVRCFSSSVTSTPSDFRTSTDIPLPHLLPSRSHTLDFFSQALPTPNFNTLAGHPAASSPTANRGLEADAATRALGRRPSDLEVSPMAENTRQNKGPEDEEALSGGMDIPWNW